MRFHGRPGRAGKGAGAAGSRCLSLLPSFVETNIQSTNPPWGQDVLQARDSVTSRKLCPRSLRRAHGHVEIQLMLHCILETRTGQAPDEKLIHFTDGGGGSSGGNARTRHRRLCRSCPEGKGGGPCCAFSLKEIVVWIMRGGGGRPHWEKGRPLFLCDPQHTRPRGSGTQSLPVPMARQECGAVKLPRG